MRSGRRIISPRRKVVLIFCIIICGLYHGAVYCQRTPIRDKIPCSTVFQEVYHVRSFKMGDYKEVKGQD